MRRYTEEVKEFISGNICGTTTKDLVALVNSEFGLDFTESKMKSYKKNHGLKSGTPHGLPAGRPSEKYPDEVVKFIRENHIGIGPKEMAARINETFGTNYTHSQIKGWYANHKLDSGISGHFTKSHVPFNKGNKGVFLGGEVAEACQFKKGNKSWNWVPLGSERINGDGYVDIKIADGKLQKNWKGKHILIWEEHNGPVPPGHVVIFGDGNRRNFDPDNLILVSRAQLAVLNKRRLIQDDADLTRTGIIVADVYRKIGERKKNKA